MIRFAVAVGTLSFVTMGLGAGCSSSDDAFPIRDASATDASSLVAPAAGGDGSADSGSLPDGLSASGCSVENPAVMAKYDPTRGCFDDPAPVVGICNGTTGEGGGTGGLACAFAADGSVYAEMVCENCGLSGAGFRYSQFVFNDDMPDTPLAEQGTDAQVAQCAAFDCVPLCSNGQPFGVSHVYGPMQCADAGTSDAGPSDASSSARDD